MLDSIVGGALFLKLFPKARMKRILFQTKKKSQVSGHIHFEHISYLLSYLLYLSFPGYLNLKVILKLFPEQIQKSGLNPVNIPCENLAY